MDFFDLIKNIVEKIKLWFKNLFRKKNKKKKELTQKPINKKNKQYISRVITENDNKTVTINTIYRKANYEELINLNKKMLLLKNKVEKGYNPQNIKITNDINKMLKTNDIHINQIDNLYQLIDKATMEIDINNHLNTNEKLNILKEDIAHVIDEKLTEYEKDTIKKH